MIKWLVLNKKQFLGICASFVVGSAFSQINVQEYKAKYPGTNIVQLNRNESVKIDLVGSEIKTVVTSSEDYLILNNEGTSIFSEDEIDFSSFETIKQINAYSYPAGEKNGKKIKATNFRTKSAEKDENIFHDDIKTTTFFYPGLKEGMVKHLDYTMEFNEYRFPHGYRFFAYYPLEKTEFTIDHDTSIHLLRYDYNFEGYEIDFKETVVKNRRIWTWTCTKVPSFRLDNYAPKPTYFLPGTYSQISHYNVKGKRINVLGSLDDLIGWYSTNVDAVLAEKPSEGLISTTKSIVDGIDNDFEKVKAIYYWVQDHIKYIAFEEGIEGFVPRMANQVCEKRYGDCKDMAVLIYKMLEVAEIKGGKIVWIGTNNIPFKYSDFPSSAVDDHMIAAYEYNGKTYFLDATSSLQPIEVPAFSIQGKEALVFGGRNDYRIEKVPVPTQEITNYNAKYRIEIQNKKILGTADQTVSGYYNWIVRMRLGYMSDLSDIKKVERFRNLGNNSYKVTAALIKLTPNREEDLYMDYKFEVDNYVTSYENETFVNLVLDKSINKEKQLKSSRLSPFSMDFFSDNTYETELVIPEGMKVKSIPETLEYKSDKVDFSIRYEIEDGLVKMKMNTVFKFLYLQPNEFHLWNEYVTIVDKALGSSVVLIKE